MVKINVCEWCGMVQPKSMYKYYQLQVFCTNHVLCDDCYDRLTIIEND